MSDPDQVPPGFEIKGNEDSDLYHVPGSRYYDQTTAELWFRSIDAAEGAGFSPAGGAADTSDDDVVAAEAAAETAEDDVVESDESAADEAPEAAADSAVDESVAEGLATTPQPRPATTVRPTQRSDPTTARPRRRDRQTSKSRRRLSVEISRTRSQLYRLPSRRPQSALVRVTRSADGIAVDGASDGTRRVGVPGRQRRWRRDGVSRQRCQDSCVRPSVARRGQR